MLWTTGIGASRIEIPLMSFVWTKANYTGRIWGLIADATTMTRETWRSTHTVHTPLWTMWIVRYQGESARGGRHGGRGAVFVRDAA